MPQDCTQCVHPLDDLRRPLRRLRWTRHWWRGLASFVSHPLRVCTHCGSIYTYEGELVAAGAAETDAEMRIRGFKYDMAALRDGFATLVLAGEISAIWTLMSSTPYDISVTIIAGTLISQSMELSQVQTPQAQSQSMELAMVHLNKPV